MSLVFWALLILAVAFTGGFIYSITASVRAYHRGEHLDNRSIRFKGGNLRDFDLDYDLDFFCGKWMFVFWVLTIVWGILEGAIRLLS